MSRSWGKGSTTAWRKIRAAVLLANQNENDGRCVVNVGKMCPRHGKPCPNICTGTATTAHHTRGKAFGDDMRYIVASCAQCNGHVGNPANISPEPRPVSKW